MPTIQQVRDTIVNVLGSPNRKKRFELVVERVASLLGVIDDRIFERIDNGGVIGSNSNDPFVIEFVFDNRIFLVYR